MATDNQARKILILLILALARIKRKEVILSPIAIAALVAIVSETIVRFHAGEVLQLHRAERNVMIRARRQEIRLPY